MSDWREQVASCQRSGNFRLSTHSMDKHCMLPKGKNRGCRKTVKNIQLGISTKLEMDMIGNARTSNMHDKCGLLAN